MERMNHYILRLDDASEYMDVDKWQRMETLLDKYNIKPLVGIIPDNQDPSLAGVYTQDSTFWDKASAWRNKGWELALHGCYHVYTTQEGGLNPVNKRSEFAGVPYEQQCAMIQHGVEILKSHNIMPRVFFAPSHTFDENTIKALKAKSDIRIISDTVAKDSYYQEGIYFIPQQSGRVRKLPFKVCTFCYHPNMMQDEDYEVLENFIQQYQDRFTADIEAVMNERSFGKIDSILRVLYFKRKNK